MNLQKVLDQTGHSEHAFNPKNVVEVGEAERRFKELTGKGFRAAELKENGRHEIVKGFNPESKETLFVPPLQGG